MDESSTARAEIEQAIATLEDNLRDLLEEAASYSGAGDEDRAADRIADVERQLETLKAQRDQLG